MTSSFNGLSIYQVYPRSFADANGDGVGDLRGITARLPYIAGMNVDAVWISPFYPSPMKDFGYDVSDYCNVDPIFGSLNDFRELAATASKLDLLVMVDLVLSHTSDQHPWFVESASSRSNRKADWYIWVDGDKDTPPNNWLSIFGGSAWQWHEGRRQYYLHNFLVQQPDLDLHNPLVQEELLNVMRFWLELGVGGFRFDTLNYYFHDPLLRDDPLKPEGGRALNAPDVNPYGRYQHDFSINRPETLMFIERLRKLLDEYDAVGLGEVGADKHGHDLIAEYTRGDKRMHFCYDFSLLGGELELEPILDTIRVGLENPDSNICNTMSNHDTQRVVTRWGAHLDEKERDALARMLPVLLVGMRGALCIYQGEELGLTEADIPYEKIQDPYGKTFYPDFKGRDGCRTPMVWDETVPSAGFSLTEKTAEPWLPIPPEHLPLAVNRQLAEKDSLLLWFRRVLAFQKANAVLREGSMQAGAKGSLLHIDRRLDGEGLSICCNLGDEDVQLPPELAESEMVLASNYAEGRFAAYGCAVFTYSA